MKLFPFSTLKFWYFSTNGRHGKGYFFQNTTAQKVKYIPLCNLCHWKDKSIYYKMIKADDNFDKSYCLQASIN